MSQSLVVVAMGLALWGVLFVGRSTRSRIFSHRISAHKIATITGGAGKFLGAGPDPALAEAARNGLAAMATAGRKLQVSTWNIAAINNNPFEYWITYDENPDYEKIMTSIEGFLEEPGDKDVPVAEVFTEDMFSQLEKRMDGVGWDNVRSYWDADFKKRKIVSGFMKVRRKRDNDMCNLCWMWSLEPTYSLLQTGPTLGKQALGLHAW